MNDQTRIELAFHDLSYDLIERYDFISRYGLTHVERQGSEGTRSRTGDGDGDLRQMIDGDVPARRSDHHGTVTIAHR